MATDIQSFYVKGAIAAPATAFKENGDINPDAIEKYVDFLLDHDVDGVFLMGTLGEGMSLTLEERKQIAAAWVDKAKGRLTTIIHIGTGNIRDSIELAKHAESIKVSAIACISPYYHKPGNEESLVDYLAQVSSAAPSTPFYYYCINFMTGVHLNTAKVLEMAHKRIPAFRGVKMSSRELPNLMDCTSVADGKLNILIGTDEQFLTALALDVQVPVLNGYLCRLFKRLKAAFDRGDIATARREQHTARKVINLRLKYGEGPTLTKAIMKCLGLDLGPVRVPLESIPDDRLNDLKEDLKEIGLIS